MSENFDSSVEKVLCGASSDKDVSVPDSISAECRWCADGDPEWSSFASEWIHRRNSIDRECLRKHLSPAGEPTEQTLRLLSRQDKKLFAAEARIKELEQALDDKHEIVLNLERTLFNLTGPAARQPLIREEKPEFSEKEENVNDPSPLMRLLGYDISPETCLHTHKRFITCWMCADCGTKL